MATAEPAVSPPPASSPSEGRYGEVFDRGYAHYTGERLGRRQAFRSLIVYSMKRSMGIRKSWTAKILPFFLYLAAIIPVIVMIGLTALVPQANMASYPNYFLAIFTIVGIFVAAVAPEMLCVDRRERTLPLYFARAITRFDYVLAKVLATAILTMTLSVVPVVILWLGRQLVAESPGQAMRANVEDLGKVVLVGSLIALVLGTAGLVISSLTDRRIVAVAIIVVGFLILTATANIGYELLGEEAEWARYLLLISPSDLFGSLIYHLFTDSQSENGLISDAEFSLRFKLLYMLGFVVVGILFIRWRYAPKD
ncbi:MAG: ABC transporter permease [Chloroflexia bacterium]|nr:ABC transporter permease [Chloroflexia bacterium]